jgi:hypothetical protein
MEHEVIFVDRPVDVRLKDGVVFAEVRSGDRVFHLAGSIPTFIATFANFGLVAHQWRVAEDGTDVIELAQFRA